MRVCGFEVHFLPSTIEVMGSNLGFELLVMSAILNVKMTKKTVKRCEGVWGSGVKISPHMFRVVGSSHSSGSGCVVVINL